MPRRALVVIALLILICGCAKKKRAPVTPAAPRAGNVAMPRVGDEETGIASWYGNPYHGRRASNGEIYDMDRLTAAHRTLPFNTMVRVRNLSNDRTVDVRIIDRGPFVDGRIIDLSRAAAREIAMIGPGTAKVRVTVIAVPQDAPPGAFAVQVGAFRERDNAERERRRMAERYGEARLALRGGDPPLWRVLVGKPASAEAAGALASRIRQENDGAPAFLVRIDGSETH